MFDVAIVGSGPAGASCAAFCAMAGMRTLLLEREKFPREKVCGDCLNPSCTPVLERLGVAREIRALPHGKLSRVDFIAIGGKTISIDLPPNAEVAVKRSLLDQLLMRRAAQLGAEIRDGVVVTSVAENAGWRINDSITARTLVAADGRNSTIARLLGMLPRIEKERVALQTHLPFPKDFGERVVLQFLPQGYSGQAPVNDNELNLCLVGKPKSMLALRMWAESRFGVSLNHSWRTITPLRRETISPARRNLFFVGDAARVVEPFTGEGIFYALRSGELAAETIAANRDDYASAHEKLYRGRLWINRIARTAVLSPHMTSLLMRSGVMNRKILRTLTRKIVADTP
ncbi:MAG: NAD(P)/FAD-dependent oxidoreductase [Verrucomicrobiota bacterium]|nr:NAD(P)/FAD-dependent oxidoreductase [Verrucomicrobiota bacterium]